MLKVEVLTNRVAVSGGRSPVRGAPSEGPDEALGARVDIVNTHGPLDHPTPYVLGPHAASHSVRGHGPHPKLLVQGVEFGGDVLTWQRKVDKEVLLECGHLPDGHMDERTF